MLLVKSNPESIDTLDDPLFTGESEFELKKYGVKNQTDQDERP